MDAFYERLIVRAATIDELLSDDFEPLPGQKADADLAARRLAAWCQASASGDWSLFGQRLQRDGWAIEGVLKRFATIRRKASVPPPAWVDDANWIEGALGRFKNTTSQSADECEPYAFDHLFKPLVMQAAELLWSGLDRRTVDNLATPARAGLHQSLLKELCNLCAPAIYEWFVIARNAGEAPKHAHGTLRYDQFVSGMKSGGFRRLFEEKPVLLRLIAVMTRQWIETSREFPLRLAADLPAIRRDILGSNAESPVAKID